MLNYSTYPALRWALFRPHFDRPVAVEAEQEVAGVRDVGKSLEHARVPARY